MKQGMDIENFFAELDEYFRKNELDKVEPYLLSSLEEAKENGDYAAYISIGNEMIGFYRSVSQCKKSFDIAEDVLLLMEELQLEDSEHFATTLLNAATAYRAAGDAKQAYRYYRQALAIYDRLLPAGDYRFAGLYNNMGILLEQMGENGEAAEMSLKALEIIRALRESEAEQATTLPPPCRRVPGISPPAFSSRMFHNTAVPVPALSSALSSVYLFPSNLPYISCARAR